MALGAFVVRVLLQPAASVTGWHVLPSFDAWQSGALPYPWLLTSQVLIVIWMARAAGRVSAGAERPSRRLGQGVAVFAGLYGALMVARLVLGLTFFRGHWWLDAPLPTVFHLVIAAYLGVYAHFHLVAGPSARSRP